MKKRDYRPYILLALFCFTLLYLPARLVGKMRAKTRTFAEAPWAGGSQLRSLFDQAEGEEDVGLSAENALLRKQNRLLRDRLFDKEQVESSLKKIEIVTSWSDGENASFYERRRKAAEKQLELQLFSLPATVVFRSPSEWNTTLWIDVGEETNRVTQQTVVAIGSPVLKGPYLIGVVEVVEAQRSLVRLLTDGSLAPAVRVARGGEENRELIPLLLQVIDRLRERGGSATEIHVLETFYAKLEKKGLERFLAKGELMGSSGPLWRGRSEILKGVGFNYDFADAEGPARELRSGKPRDRISHDPPLALIAVGDLLVTTGMDGVFPADLPVAHVTEVAPLKEGSPSFDIEARLCAGKLDTLRAVTVLPPLTSPCSSL